MYEMVCNCVLHNQMICDFINSIKKVNNTKNSNKNVNAKQVPKEETTFYAEELGDVILSDNDLTLILPSLKSAKSSAIFSFN